MLFAAFALASLFGAFAAGALIGPQLQAQFFAQDVSATGSLALTPAASSGGLARAYLETDALGPVYIQCETLPAAGSEVTISGRLGTYCPDSVCFAQITGQCL